MSTWTKRALLRWQSEHREGVAFRNNRGVAWQGDVRHTRLDGESVVIIHRPRRVAFGLPYPKKGEDLHKGGDYITVERETAYAECPRCREEASQEPTAVCPRHGLPLKRKNIAVYGSLEIKSRTDRIHPAQERWAKYVEELGGHAALIREEKEEDSDE